MRRAFVAGITGIAALALAAGCGGGADDAADTETFESAAAGFNGADVMFAQMMIAHHE